MEDETIGVGLARAWIRASAEQMRRNAEELCALDQAIGDGDHGTNMRRGFDAVEKALAEAEPDEVGALLVLTGRTLISSVGGAAGPLYGSAFRAAGRQVGARASGEEFLAALRAALEAVQKLGGARPGDKTIVDALAPAVDAFARALDQGPAAATREAARAAQEGARATIALVARKGRASYLGERSAGHQDPGATSTALLLRALADAADTA